jgi:hypothetical protein
MSSCGPIFMSGNFNDTVGTMSGCKIKEQSIYLVSSKICILWYIIFHIYIYIYIVRHVETHRSHHHRLTKAKVCNQHNNICSTPPYKGLIYVINGVAHNAGVGRYIDCKKMDSTNNRKLLNSWINMWTEGTVDVSGKACTSITGVLAHPTVCKHKCWSGVDGTYCHKVLPEP